MSVKKVDISINVSVICYSEVNAEVTDKYGFTPLMQAAQKGYTEWVKLYIVRKNALSIAACYVVCVILFICMYDVCV